MDTNENTPAAVGSTGLAGAAGSVSPGEYPPEWEWVVETTHGIYTDRKWGYCTRQPSKEAAIRFCEEWTTGPRWDIYRVYNNRTGEIIAASPNTKVTHGRAQP